MRTQETPPEGTRRGRKPHAPGDVIDIEPNPSALQAASDALAVIGPRQREIAARFGAGMPYDRVRVCDEARFFLGHAQAAFLEVGRRLILIKEHEPHGDYVQMVESLGLTDRTARRMMQATLKFSSPKLAGKDRLMQLGQSKLFELLVEDDEALAELEDGGTVAGLKLDEMQLMSRADLRAALSEARQREAAKDRVIADKNRKLDALAEERHRRHSDDTTVHEQAQLDMLRTRLQQADLAIAGAVAAVLEVMAEPATERATLTASQAVEQLLRQLIDACLRHGLPLDLAADADPFWLADIRAAAAAGHTVSEQKAAARAAQAARTDPSGRNGGAA